MSISTESLERFYKCCKEAYIELSKSEDIQMIFHYTGVLSQGFSNAFTSRVELLISDAIESKQAQKRFFTVYVEVIQNILIHGVQDADKDVHASMNIFIKGGKLCGRFSNIVHTENTEKLMNRYREANAMSRPELKEKYMDVMVNGNLSQKGGAGLGVITVVLRSKNPADVAIFPLEDSYQVFESTFFIDI